MTTLFKLFALFVIFKTVLSHNEDVHTIQYNSESFDEEIGKKNHFIMFFAPW